MTEPELKKLYESAAGFEDKADAVNDAARLAEYIATHHMCRAGHHRPKDQEQWHCGLWASYYVTSYPDAQ
jgi:hypothetical protein